MGMDCGGKKQLKVEENDREDDCVGMGMLIFSFNLLKPFLKTYLDK